MIQIQGATSKESTICALGLGNGIGLDRPMCTKTAPNNQSQACSFAPTISLISLSTHAQRISSQLRKLRQACHSLKPGAESKDNLIMNSRSPLRRTIIFALASLSLSQATQAADILSMGGSAPSISAPAYATEGANCNAPGEVRASNTGNVLTCTNGK